MYFSFSSFRSRAMILMLCGSILISFTGLIIRNMDSAGALEINFLRGISLSITVFLILFLRYGRASASKVIAVGKPGLVAGTLLAIAGICLLQAMTNTTVAATLFICSSIPFVTACLAWFILKEKITSFTLSVMLCAAIGVSLMFLNGSGSKSNYGLFMALLTAISFSVFAITVRKNRNIEMLPALAISGIIISLFCFTVIGKNFSFTWLDLLRCFLLGSFISLVPNMIFLYSSKHLLAAELTFFMLIEFALGPFWVWVFINEVPAFWTLIGGFIIMSSVMAFIWKEVKTQSLA